MKIEVPYQSTGQELGETRMAMTKTLMKDIEKLVDANKKREGKYYILVHAKPWPNYPNLVKIKQLCLSRKPPMMLSCLLFGVDNNLGKLTLEWALPGDWPTWSVGGTQEPVPETIASVNKSGIKYHYENFLPDV